MIREENIRLIFGLKIKQLRQMKGWSLLELSKISGLSPSYLNEIEKGKKYPKANKIVSLAEVFNVTYDDLVSLKLAGPLAPMSDLLRSNIITDLPLNIFGFDLGKMVESLHNSPAKVGAFVSTIVEIARNYEKQKERFYFAALRSYQEVHNNYFQEMEEGCDYFVKKFDIDPHQAFSYERAISILTERYDYNVEEYSLEEYPELKSNRYVRIPGKEKDILLLNPKLSTNQRLFVVGRELAFNILKVKKRANISMLVEVNSFDHILNNFLASYCAAAVLINRDRLQEDLDALFDNVKWNGQQFLNMLSKYQVSPDVLMHRMTGLIPKFMGIKDLIFLRYQHDLQKDRFELTKELYLGNTTNPAMNQPWQHYCRRFNGMSLLNEIVQTQVTDGPRKPIVAVQIIQHLSTDEEYFCITVARDLLPTPNLNSSVTIGFKISPQFRKKVKFWNDPSIVRTVVNTTCEACHIMDCKERVAEPEEVLKRQNSLEVKEALDKLQQEYI